MTESERRRTEYYCRYDVDATEILWKLRQGYLDNKVAVGAKRGLTDRKAMYMTNAKLTSVYLQAEKPEKPWTDERNYQYPDKLLRQYIPQEIFDFFDRLHDPNVPDIDLFGGYDQYGRKIKGASIEFRIGDCVCTIAYGGIHGAIPNYVEVATENRSIRNKDVGSYYPHLMTIPLSAGQQYGFCSRNIPSPQIFVDMLEERMKAKKAGDKKTANALKLVANTSYGAMLNGKNGISYNDLYDPLMGRSVCITGQLLLLELSMHLVAECPTLKIIQLNTDGIMVSFDKSDEAKWQEITQEWQDRTGFELEEDFIQKIVQRDVNNYVEVPVGDGKPKVKGGNLVRGILTNANIDFTTMGLPAWDNMSGGAWNINTGGEEITARELYQTAITFKPQFTMWLSCNDLPAVKDKSLFASDRVRVIEFNRHFNDDEQDKGLKDYFESPEAMRGIFTWLVAGYFKYRRFGLKMSANMQKVVKQYEKDNDLVLQYLEEKCQKQDDVKTRAKTLYDNYKLWCKSNGYYVCSMKKFNAELMAHPEWYEQKSVSGGVAVYYGIMMKTTG